MGLRIVKKSKGNLAVAFAYGFVCTKSIADRFNIKEEP